MLELTIRLVFSLAIVLGLLLLLARFGGRRFRGNRDAMVRVLHRQALSRGSAVSVVAVGSRVLVLGTTEQQVRVLTELDPEEVASSAPVLSLARAAADREPETRKEGAGQAVPRDTSGASVRALVRPTGRPGGPLAGSVLSADTWRQALAAATRRSS